jgi:hypothetical protein
MMADLVADSGEGNHLFRSDVDHLSTSVGPGSIMLNH